MRALEQSGRQRPQGARKYDAPHTAAAAAAADESAEADNSICPINIAPHTRTHANTQRRTVRPHHDALESIAVFCMHAAVRSQLNHTSSAVDLLLMWLQTSAPMTTERTHKQRGRCIRTSSFWATATAVVKCPSLTPNAGVALAEPHN